MNADQLLDNYNKLQKIELRKNLRTFTLKELKKEIIKMKADKFAVTKMKRRQIIELSVQYHYLFPHLLTKKGSKKSAKPKKPQTPVIQNISQTNTSQITPQTPAIQNIPQTQTLPQATLQHLKNLAKYNPSALKDVPLDFVQQLNLPK